VAHRVLDVVPEDPEEPHVADQVKPAPMHEHGAQRSEPAAIAGYDADGGTAHGKAEPVGQETQKLAGNETQLADRSGQIRLRAHSLHPDPENHVCRDEEQGDDRCRQGGIVVPVREHGSI
jgi:hypothetical protein